MGEARKRKHSQETEKEDNDITVTMRKMHGMPDYHWTRCPVLNNIQMKEEIAGLLKKGTIEEVQPGPGSFISQVEKKDENSDQW